MLARSVLTRRGSSTLVVLAGSASQSRSAMIGLAENKMVDVDWIRLTQARHTGRLIGKLHAPEGDSVDLEKLIEDCATFDQEISEAASHSLLLEGVLPLEAQALGWPARAAIGSGSILQLSIHKRPYVHDLTGYYIHLHSLGSMEALSECAATFRGEWLRNGFHQGHLRILIEGTQEESA